MLGSGLGLGFRFMNINVVGMFFLKIYDCNNVGIKISTDVMCNKWVEGKAVYSTV